MKSTLALSLLGALLLASGCDRQPQVAPEDVRPVRSTIVGASQVSVSASYSGAVHARHESKLGFQTSGRVVARLVEVGSAVKRGQPLMRLDPAQETLHVAAAVADSDAARSRVAQNRIDLQRTEALHARQFASAAEVDQARLALAQSEAQLQAAQAQQQLKVNQRGFTTLVADRDGVVTAIDAEAGQVVSPGQAVVTVAADGEREVVVAIAESRVDELTRATSLQVSVWAQPGKTYVGTLRELAPATDSVSRTYSARIAVRNPDAALRLGMTATVTAAVVGDAALRLPLTAIVQRDGEARVWVLDPQAATVSLRNVTLGAVQQNDVVVAQGLVAGETVVTAGVHMLVPGQKVKAVEAAAATHTAAAAAGKDTP